MRAPDGAGEAGCEEIGAPHQVSTVAAVEGRAGCGPHSAAVAQKLVVGRFLLTTEATL
jgi:hypothetical protein